MSSKLRPLYDKIYMGIDVGLLAINASRVGKRRAKPIPRDPQLDVDYRDKIRPYWRQFRVTVPKKYWYKFLGSDPRYIPNDLWYRRIVPYFNTVLFAQALQDKCMHNIYVPGVKRPKTIVKNVAGHFCADDLTPLTEAEAIACCHDAGRILIKPSVGSGEGRNIRFYDSGSLGDEEIASIFREYGRNFIVQEKMTQHPALAALNPSSLNTVRIMTFLFRGEVHILSTILRVGGKNSEVDNFSQGGFQFMILPDGRLDPHPSTKRNWGGGSESPDFLLEDVEIPSFDRIIRTVKHAALRMPHFAILGWDIGVDPDGEPVLIEYNVIPGQNHGTCGPTFGDLTDEVLGEVFGRRTDQ